MIKDKTKAKVKKARSKKNARIDQAHSPKENIAHKSRRREDVLKTTQPEQKKKIVALLAVVFVLAFVANALNTIYFWKERKTPRIASEKEMPKGWKGWRKGRRWEGGGGSRVCCLWMSQVREPVFAQMDWFLPSPCHHATMSPCHQVRPTTIQLKWTKNLGLLEINSMCNPIFSFLPFLLALSGRAHLSLHVHTDILMCGVAILADRIQPHYHNTH